jgi:hypothetical protein
MAREVTRREHGDLRALFRIRRQVLMHILFTPYSIRRPACSQAGTSLLTMCVSVLKQLRMRI